jgi:hypothetical protein
MPANVVRTSREERLWDKAKAIAKRAGHTKDYNYIMGVFKKMLPSRFNKQAEISDALILQAVKTLEKSASTPQTPEELFWSGFFGGISEELEKRAGSLRAKNIELAAKQVQSAKDLAKAWFAAGTREFKGVKGGTGVKGVKRLAKGRPKGKSVGQLTGGTFGSRSMSR